MGKITVSAPFWKVNVHYHYENVMYCGIILEKEQYFCLKME